MKTLRHCGVQTSWNSRGTGGCQRVGSRSRSGFTTISNLSSLGISSARAFITRNFAEYSAIFYGSFVGVDVAYFYNHSVQPNEMYLDYKFTSENAVGNLLEQVPSEFTSTVSALNIDVVDHLLVHQPDLAKEVVAYIASHDANKDVLTFLGSYFNTPDAQHEAFVRLLAEHPWHSVLEYVAGDHAIPNNKIRLRLLNSALLHAQAVDSYEIGEATVELLDAHHLQMMAIAADQTPIRTARVLEILESAEIVVADLSHLSKPLRERVVAKHLYEISVANLKQALEIETAPTLDEVKKDEHVWDHCRSHIDRISSKPSEATSRSRISSSRSPCLWTS